MDAKSALTQMTRIAQRRGLDAARLERGLRHNLERLAPLAVEVGLETGDPIGQVLAGLLAEGGNPRLAKTLHGLVPEETTALRELALVVTWQCWTALEGKAPGPAQANVLNNLAARNLDLGMVEAALPFARESARLYRTMAEGRPELFRTGLAMSLNTLSVALAGLGEFADALEMASESVACYRECSGGDGEGRLLAQSLNTLANRHLQLGHWHLALAASEESNALLDRRADAPPADLARARDTLAYTLARCGRLDEAATKGEDALRLYVSLAEARADAFLPLLALCQSNQAGVLLRQGRHAEAADLAERAAAVYAGLASARAEAFQWEQAKALCTLGMARCAAGHYAAAEDSLRELLGLLDSLGDGLLDYRTLKAEALRTLARVLTETGRDEEAIRAAEQAVAFYANLPRPAIEAHLPDLAGAGETLSYALFNAERLAEAAHALEEAIIVYRLLHEQQPDLFQDDLLGALVARAHVLLLLGEHGRAFEVLREAFALTVPHTFASPEGAVFWEAVREEFLARAATADAAALDDPVGLVQACVRAIPVDGEA